MRNILILFLCGFLTLPAQAQEPKDALFAKAFGSRLMLIHPVQKGEKISEIARRYAVAPEAVAAENGIAFPAALKEGAALRIPLGKQNLTDTFSIDVKPVYFFCEGRENLVALSGSTGISFKNLQLINFSLKQYCTNGTRVLVGYLRQNAARQDEVVPEKDFPEEDSLELFPEPEPIESPVEAAPVHTAEASFQLLVESGVTLTEESGPVVFFPGGTKDVYYAFHNTASHGTILRIGNPANGRVVYAKVIGKVPRTKQYYKAAAAVSDNARRALGSLGDARMWCEIAYAGY